MRHEDENVTTSRFPIMLAIPAAVWIAHGLGAIGFAIDILNPFFLKRIPLDRLCASIFLMGFTVFFIGSGVAILRGHYFGLAAIQTFSPLLSAFAFSLLIYDGAVIIVASEGAMFASCGILTFLYGEPWKRWVSSHRGKPKTLSPRNADEFREGMVESILPVPERDTENSRG